MPSELLFHLFFKAHGFCRPSNSHAILKLDFSRNLTHFPFSKKPSPISRILAKKFPGFSNFRKIFPRFSYLGKNVSPISQFLEKISPMIFSKKFPQFPILENQKTGLRFQISLQNFYLTQNGHLELAGLFLSHVRILSDFLHPYQRIQKELKFNC